MRFIVVQGQFGDATVTVTPLLTTVVVSFRRKNMFRQNGAAFVFFFFFLCRLLIFFLRRSPFGCVERSNREMQISGLSNKIYVGAVSIVRVPKVLFIGF